MVRARQVLEVSWANQWSQYRPYIPFPQISPYFFGGVATGFVVHKVLWDEHPYINWASYLV
jgi:hypothetical protein